MTLKKGYLYLFAAAVCYSFMGFLVKFLAHELSPVWQTFFRLSVAAVLAFGFLTLRGKKPLLSVPQNWPVVILMGVIAYGSSVLAYTYALALSPIVNVTFIFSTYPVVATIMAILFLKEKIRANHIIGIVLLLVGLVLIFDPHDINKYLLGNIVSLYVAASFALYVIISRYLNTKGETPETITFLSITIGAIFSAVLAFFLEPFPRYISFATAIAIVIFGFLNFAAHIFVNLGFKTVPAANGTMILMTEMLITAILAFIILQEAPTVLLVIGALLVAIAVYISLRQ